ncbi:MAG: (S)-ureidoglycine aminohydrolase [Thermoanaerobaculia bacterium]
MTELFGHTRAHVGPRHALITPANHVASVIPGVAGATCVVLINPAMGAGMTQMLWTFEAGGGASLPANDLETFGYVMTGEVKVSLAGAEHSAGPGGFFFSPAGKPWGLSQPEPGTRLTLFQKRYAPLAGAGSARPLFGNAAEVAGAPFLGDPAANLQVLLPDELAYDLAVNLFTYQPGGHLPFVEIHIMEHGLILLGGAGVYRLEDSWYPVEAGDAIWMAPYCAQWFVAMGKVPASYLYYKDVNRPPQ